MEWVHQAQHGFHSPFHILAGSSLVSSLGQVHLGVACEHLILGADKCCDYGGIYVRPFPQSGPLSRQLTIEHHRHGPSQMAGPNNWRKRMMVVSLVLWP